jgi:hypothetical protein
MTVNKDYENLLLKSWDSADEQVRYVIFKNRKVNTVDNGRHTMENHVYWEERLGEGKCPYCREGGRIVGVEEMNKDE